jgi:glycosyltransferase involved in cell wall biosynthesis
VIPAYNEAQYLPETIAAIRRAERSLGEAVEIIVGNNASTDDTARVAESLGAIVVPVEIRCISAVRNRAAERATGKYLVFVDADDHMSENLFVEVKRVLDSGRYIGGGVSRTRYDRETLGIRATHAIVQTSLSFTGLSMFLFYTTAEAFAAAGKFNEALLCTEDYDFARRLRDLGRARGLRYKNLRSAYLVKSARKFSQFGDWAVFLSPLFSLRIMLKDTRTIQAVWYDQRHNESPKRVAGDLLSPTCSEGDA